jgi:hypothetical protein
MASAAAGAPLEHKEIDIPPPTKKKQKKKHQRETWEDEEDEDDKRETIFSKCNHKKNLHWANAFSGVFIAASGSVAMIPIFQKFSITAFIFAAYNMYIPLTLLRLSVI